MKSLRFKDESMEIINTKGKDATIKFNTVMIDENGNELNCKFSGELKSFEILFK